MATVSQISYLNVSHIDTRLKNAKGSRSEPRHEGYQIITSYSVQYRS